MVGAYVLAGKLATHDDPADAFANYQKRMRRFAVANQDLADDGGTFLLPRTQAQIDVRNRVLAGVSAAHATATPGDTPRAHSSLQLADEFGALRGRH